ncbi:MAG: MarC family protein [Bdellovibrionota bacterium]
MESDLVKFIAALFAIMNPATAIPVFLTVTEGRSAAEQRRIAVTAAIAVFVILLVAALFGKQLLTLFGISIASFEAAGGIIILLMSLSMLRAESSRVHHSSEESQEGSQSDNPAFFPIAIPLLAGPGAISTAIIFSERLSSASGIVIIGIGIAVMALVLALSLSLAGRIAGVLGKTGMNIVSRIMGMILAAIAVEMIASGLKTLLPGLV